MDVTYDCKGPSTTLIQVGRAVIEPSSYKDTVPRFCILSFLSTPDIFYGRLRVDDRVKVLPRFGRRTLLTLRARVYPETHGVSP